MTISTDSKQDVYDWNLLRKEFTLLEQKKSETVTFFLASHPKTVHEAIKHHRSELDKDPYGYYIDNIDTLTQDVFQIIGEYMGSKDNEVALTNSTTMGLAMLYNGLILTEQQEILTTVHEHYATKSCLQFRHQRMGTPIRTISLYKDIFKVSKQEMVAAVAANITPKTRVLALTWVDSATGVKLPAKEIGDLVKQLNKSRKEEDKIIFCLDAVHGFGIENFNINALGCDFFVTGCHKWLFGPRGTGFLWGKESAWKNMVPTMPSFISPTFTGDNYGAYFTPGGFNAFEHHWALKEAFEFHLKVGKQRIESRVYALNRLLKQGLAAIPGIEVYTPLDSSLSAGITVFDLSHHDKQALQKYLANEGIYASIPIVADRYLIRLSPGIVTDEQGIDNILRVVGNFLAENDQS